MSQRLIISVTLVILSLAQLLPGEVEAHGLGEEFLRIHDTSADQEHDDKLFKPSQKDLDLLDAEELASAFKAMEIDVVAPNKQLRDTMNTISTKVRSMFLGNYDHYFRELDIGSTSRPMLYTYLGLKFATAEQISGWYEQQRKRIQSRVQEGCKSLATLRARLFSGVNKKQQDLYDSIVAKDSHISRPYIAHTILKNNLNLFMLENYLLLCSRLEPSLDEVKLLI